MFNIFQKFKKAVETIRFDFAPRNPVRQIINGKLYDIAKAEKLIVFFCNDNGVPDILGVKAGYAAILFVSPHKNFFVQQFGVLHAISDDMAKVLLADYPDQYIKYFGEVEEA